MHFINVMQKIFNFNLKNYINKKNFFILFITSIWLSLDTTFFEIKNFNIFIFIRFIAPYIFFIISLFLLFNEIFYNKKKNNLNYFFYFSVLLFCSQFIGLFITNNSILNFSFSLSCIFLFILIYLSANDEFSLYKLLKISLFILFIILAVYGYEILKHFYTESTNRHLYGSWPYGLAELKGLSSNVPRSSGLSRNAMVLFIFFSFKLFLKKKKFNPLYQIIFIFLSTIIILTQSRIILLYYLIFSLAYLFSLIISNSMDYKNKFYNFILVFIIPIVFIILSVEYKNYSIIKKSTLDYYYTLGELSIVYKTIEDAPNSAATYEELFKENEKISLHDPVIREADPKSFSSNRFGDWNKIINKNKSIFVGYGAMGDRYLINQSASNSFFYVYASSGILGLFLFSTLYFRALYLSLINIFKSKFKIDKNNYKYLITSSIVAFFLLRSLVETSFANFGIDFLLFFICFFYLENKNESISIKRI